MMSGFQGKTISWELKDGAVELALHRAPCNEIGLSTLQELEQFTRALGEFEAEAHALILHSSLPCGFCAGADLRELYEVSHRLERKSAVAGVRDFLERIHR